MKELRITQSAYQLIETESLLYETETCGLLMGTTAMPIAIKATKAGHYAEMSSTFCSNDVVHDNQTVQDIMRQFDGRVKVNGRWHKHPGRMSCPSSTDLRTAREITKRSVEKGVQENMYFIITNVVNGGVQFYCYTFDTIHQEFCPVNLQVIPDNAKDVQVAMNKEPVIIQTRNMDFWNSDGFQFYLTRFGNDRLKMEVDDLQDNGYWVRVFSGKSDKQLIMVIRKEKTIMCILPSEYPLNPPRFFCNETEIEYSLPIWNSSFRIRNILQRLEEKAVMKRSNHESLDPKTGTCWSRFFQGIKKTLRSVRFFTKKGRFDLHLWH